MKTADEMNETLLERLAAGQPDATAQLAVDLTTEAEGLRRDLERELRDLAAGLARAADRLRDEGRVNELGEVQYAGTKIDRLCGLYQAAARWAERAQQIDAVSRID